MDWYTQTLFAADQAGRRGFVFFNDMYVGEKVRLGYNKQHI